MDIGGMNPTQEFARHNFSAAPGVIFLGFFQQVVMSQVSMCYTPSCINLSSVFKFLLNSSSDVGCFSGVFQMSGNMPYSAARRGGHTRIHCISGSFS